MHFSVTETLEVVEDVAKLAAYMLDKFKNHKAALDFVEKYDKEASELGYFPFGYRGVGFEYRGYEIRMKPFGTYNIFFVVDTDEKVVVILRVLKDKQNWKSIMRRNDNYGS